MAAPMIPKSTEMIRIFYLPPMILVAESIDAFCCLANYSLPVFGTRALDSHSNVCRFAETKTDQQRIIFTAIKSDTVSRASLLCERLAIPVSGSLCNKLRMLREIINVIPPTQENINKMKPPSAHAQQYFTKENEKTSKPTLAQCIPGWLYTLILTKTN